MSTLLVLLIVFGAALVLGFAFLIIALVLDVILSIVFGYESVRFVEWLFSAGAVLMAITFLPVTILTIVAR